MLNYHTISFISHGSKVMLKILQARFQQCVNRELPDVQAEFRKDHNELLKILKEMGTPDHLYCLLQNLYMQIKKQQLELDME